MAQRKSVRSIRTADASWLAARARATKEGLSMSTVVSELVEGYALGYIDMPKTSKEFTPTRQPATAKS
jgi:hypothetical protein